MSLLYAGLIVLAWCLTFDRLARLFDAWRDRRDARRFNCTVQELQFRRARQGARRVQQEIAAQQGPKVPAVLNGGRDDGRGGSVPMSPQRQAPDRVASPGRP